MGIWILTVLGIIAGFMLFRRNTIAIRSEGSLEAAKLSVIIPARNEEANLGFLLDSLMRQTVAPYEIIVVDDFSTDRTREIAESYGVKVVTNPELPPGWTGKNWAVWNGYKHASGEWLAFLDADVRLEPRALDALVRASTETNGVISVVPMHDTERWHERLALILNILGVFAFTSPYERTNPGKGLYGSCIIAAREDYERINGHESVKSDLLDDMMLGAAFTSAGIKVTNYIGYQLVYFRMYPQNLKSAVQGFGKGALPGASALRPMTVLLNAVWITGLIVTDSFPLFVNTSFAWPLFIGYLLYTLQLFYFVNYVGSFGKTILILHMFSLLFFILVMLFSLYQVVFLGHVAWKGRFVKVGGKKDK